MRCSRRKAKILRVSQKHRISRKPQAVFSIIMMAIYNQARFLLVVAQLGALYCTDINIIINYYYTITIRRSKIKISCASIDFRRHCMSSRDFVVLVTSCIYTNTVNGYSILIPIYDLVPTSSKSKTELHADYSWIHTDGREILIYAIYTQSRCNKQFEFSSLFNVFNACTFALAESLDETHGLLDPWCSSP